MLMNVTGTFPSRLEFAGIDFKKYEIYLECTNTWCEISYTWHPKISEELRQSVAS